MKNETSPADLSRSRFPKSIAVLIVHDLIARRLTSLVVVVVVVEDISTRSDAN